MKEFNIPIFKKTYELYRDFHGYLLAFPRIERYSIGQRCEVLLLDILEGVLWASRAEKRERQTALEHTSSKLNLVRILIRLSKDIGALDNRKYLKCQGDLDEVGRMLGGWIRYIKQQ